ncbi:hypothetical protein B0H14DRAFT_2871342 [Mycena olivaceomarginata]|nr:hypothetical protein B0H14DRAFT_2871342 [Mycena olivaceomarginata]
MAVCAGPAGVVSRVCRQTSPEDGRTAQVGHGGDVAGEYPGVRIVIYGARRRRGCRSTSAASVERKDIKSIRWRRGGVIHASPLVAPVLLADLLRLRAWQRASSSFHVQTRTESVAAEAGLSNYEKRLPAAVVEDDLMDVRKIHHLRPWTRR